MAHGGARNGAGRKPGKPNTKTQAMMAAAEAEGIMPKDVLLNVMRWCYAKGDYILAAEIAKDAAPYFTPRLSAVAVKEIKPEDAEEEKPVREIIVSTREQAEALLPLLAQASGIPERT